jgi:hypothetical protein
LCPLLSCSVPSLVLFSVLSCVLSPMCSSCSFPSLCPYMISPFSSTSSRPTIVPISTNHHPRRSKRQRALAGPLICYTCKLPLVTRKTAHRIEGKTGTCVARRTSLYSSSAVLALCDWYSHSAGISGLQLLAEGKQLFSKRPDGFWGPPNLIFTGHRTLFCLESNGQNLKLNTHLHAMPKLEWIDVHLCCLCDVHRNKCNL